MKPTNPLIFLLILTFVLITSLNLVSQKSQESFCKTKTDMTDVIIDILDFRSSAVPNPEPLKHKDGEVIVFGTKFMGGDSYGIYFYQTLDGEIVCYKAFVDGTKSFNKAAYHREDVISAHILLYNTKTNEKAEYTISGKDAETTLHSFEK